MSNKAKTTTMKNDAKLASTPKLRFPEFRGASGWEDQLLAPYLDDCSGRVPPNTELPIYSSTREGLKRQDVYFDGRVLENKNDYGVVPPDCFVYRHMSDDGSFKFNINETGGDIAVSREYPVFKTIGLNSRFLLEKLNEGFDFKQFALSQKAGGTRTRLYFSRLREWRTLLPLLPEQQKIADCLTSVDELIAAQARKADAVMTYKKGLMQLLFPRPERIENGVKIPAETQPRLRFPEFQDAGEWEVMTIQEMIDKHFIVGHLDGNHGEQYPKAEEFAQNDQGIPYISANDFLNGSVDFSRCKRLPIERARVFKKGVAKDGDILFAHNATVGPVAKLNTIEEFVILSTTATYFRCNGTKLSNDFLMFALSSPAFIAQYTPVMAQSTRNQVPITTQRKLQLHLPKPPEQQRIADCLVSLDDLIVAQTQQLNALKTHKKGLMQQLFPSMENV